MGFEGECWRGLPHWLSGKESTCNAGASGDMGLIPELEEEEMATHSSVLAWGNPVGFPEEPGRLQSMGCKESDTTEVI